LAQQLLGQGFEFIEEGRVSCVDGGAFWRGLGGFAALRCSGRSHSGSAGGSNLSVISATSCANVDRGSTNTPGPMSVPDGDHRTWHSCASRKDTRDRRPMVWRRRTFVGIRHQYERFPQTIGVNSVLHDWQHLLFTWRITRLSRRSPAPDR